MRDRDITREEGHRGGMVKEKGYRARQVDRREKKEGTGEGERWTDIDEATCLTNFGSWKRATYAANVAFRAPLVPPSRCIMLTMW